MRRWDGGLMLPLLLAWILSGCVTLSGLESYQPKTPDEAMIAASLMRIPNGIRNRSVDQILQAYADDALIGNFHKYLGAAGVGAQVNISKRELFAVYTQIFRASKDVSMLVRNFQLTVSGDRALAEAMTELTFKQEAGRKESKADVYRNEVLWRIRRSPAGWRIYEEIWQ